MSKPVYDSMPVEEFIRNYGKPYDPEADDDYDRHPFIADIKEGKNDPIYNAHSYHTKVPPRAIIPYILHYTEPGDIVLDPFCGSGMTGVAAVLCEDPPKDLLEMVQAMNPGRRIRPGARRAILNDLSPAACHIAYNYCTPVDVDELKKEFERIKAAVKDEFDWLYGTEHYEPAVDLYDPQRPEVAARLKNPPRGKGKDAAPTELFKGMPPERTWELITREDVERRMGPDALTKVPLPEGAKQFICIPATIQFTVWSDVRRCEGMTSVSVAGTKATRKARRGCGKEIVLWDVAVDLAHGAVRREFRCSHCGQKWTKTKIPRISSVPVLTNYAFSGFKKSGKSTKVGHLRGERPTTQKERQLIRQVDEKPVPHWVPDVPWDQSREMWRGGHRDAGIVCLADFFTKRTLHALSTFLHHIDKVDSSRMRAAARFVFTSTFPRMSRTTRFLFHKAGNAGVAGTLYVASFTTENNFLALFGRKLEDCLTAFELMAAVSGVVKAIVLKGPAQTLAVPADTVDYIFTDPPFGSNIFYGDCSFLWESWLGELTDTKQEAVWNKSRKPEEGGKTLDNYAAFMAASFREMCRVLKPGRCATVEFNCSDGRVFEVIKRAIRDAGFQIENMLFLDKDQKSFKQVKGAKGEEDIIGQDTLFNLRKPGPGKSKSPVKQNVVNGEFEQLVMETTQEHLRSLPDRIKKDRTTYSDWHRTTPFLHTMLRNKLMPRGVNVDRLNLPFIDALCSRYFRKIENRWYLPDEAVGNGQGGVTLHPVDVEIADEVSAIEWLRQLLTREPMMVGDIKPLWMRATVKLTGDISTQLERILRQNFWLDPTTNKWREPKAEERRRMDTTERDRIRHNADRLLAGALKDVPSDAELCRWIGVLYDAAKVLEGDHTAVVGGESDSTPEEALTVCRQIVALFQRALPENVGEDLYQVASRQARMASLKLQQAEEAKPKPKSRQKTLFESGGTEG